MMGKKLLRKKLLILAVVLASLSVLLIGGYFLSRNTNTDSALLCVNDTSGQEYKEKFYLSNTELSVEFKALKDKIVNIEGYDTSVNCVYIVLKYQIYDGQLAEAKKSYEKLTILSESQNIWVDASIASEEKDALISLLEILEKQANEQTSALQGYYFKDPGGTNVQQ